jgi:hypothetical protein
MLQRLYSSLKIGMYNAIRVQLLGDGKPVHCELTIRSPVKGEKQAHGFILTSN